jgi:hypothetical protein
MLRRIRTIAPQLAITWGAHRAIQSFDQGLSISQAWGPARFNIHDVIHNDFRP